MAKSHPYQERKSAAPEKLLGPCDPADFPPKNSPLKHGPLFVAEFWDFRLTLESPKPQAGEFRKKFVGGSEVESVDAQAGCGEDIFAHVVDEHGFAGQGADFAQRVVIDRG